MMISNVKGRFSGLAGELVFDEAEVTNSRVIATLDAASINTELLDLQQLTSQRVLRW